ncbi:MAG: DUF2339 domain-containing protein [Lachnospiraceae bacterium]|nr:DUF2339 domain-containing protein [Lachnospiraceae bacterium]
MPSSDNSTSRNGLLSSLQAKNESAFRLYGLILFMTSVFKLIMIDIKYDSTLENAISFFVSGILCFIISFLYNKIDHSLKKPSSNNGNSEKIKETQALCPVSLTFKSDIP